MTREQNRLTSTATIVVALFLVAPANAAIMFKVEVNGDPDMTTIIRSHESGRLESGKNAGDEIWTNSDAMEGSGWSIEPGFVVESNPDPFISAGFTFLNTTGSTADFVITVTNTSVDEIPIPIISGETNYDLADTTGNGATLSQSTTGESLYNAFFSGDGDVRDLFPPPAGLPISTTLPNIGNISAAYADEVIAQGLSVGEDFGIRHEFRLTPFDRVTIQSTFVIVPEPSTVCLLGLGGITALWVRSRTKCPITAATLDP